MAFIEFSETAEPELRHFVPLPAPAPIQGAESGPSEEAEALSQLEWRILALSLEDDLETLRPPRKRSWLGRLLLGPQPASRALANGRLEALRRLAVETRHKGWRVPASAIAAAEKVGFSEAQIGLVIETIGHPEARFRSKLA